MILVVMPIVVGLSLFAQPSIKTLLERGQFGPEDTIQVATLLVALIGFFIASAVGDLIAKCFYSLGDTRTPSAIGAIAFTLGIFMKLLGVNYFGVLGLAIATSTYTLLSVLFMMLILFWRLKLREVHKELGFTVMRASVAAILGSLVALIVLWIPITGAWWFAVFLGALTYTILLLTMRDPTWHSMVLRQR
jgi:putative peptidoglycan lipid II flippase